MFGWFRRPRYELLIEPERFTLADGAVRVEVEPCLSVAENGRIVGLGGRPSDRSGQVVELLGPVSPTEPPRFEERFAAFVAVFRHLIRAAQQTPLFTLRPDVIVHGASVLRPLLDGHEQRFLREALVSAGATKVEFASSALPRSGRR
jgi:hypothetical protein